MTELRRRAGGKRAKSPSEHPPNSPQVRSVLVGIAQALQLVSDTEQAYRVADEARAAGLQAAADGAHRELLRRICELSEGEADRVEPLFSELEIRLLRPPIRPFDSPKGRA